MARLPRGTRVPAILMATLLVASGMGWGMVVHTPAPEEPQRPAFLSGPGEPLPPPAMNQSYALEVRYETNEPGEEAVIVRQKRYVPGPEPVVQDAQIATGQGAVVQSVSYRSGDRRYTRTTVDDREAFRESVGQPEVVESEPSSMTYYEVETSERSGASIEPRRALEGLYMLRYQRKGETVYEGRTVIRYVPTTGWTTRSRLNDDGTVTLYVRQTRGEVLVDKRTGAILRADVDGSVVQATSWAGVMTKDGRSISVEYEVEMGIDAVEEPPWVDSLENASAERQ